MHSTSQTNPHIETSDNYRRPGQQKRRASQAGLSPATSEVLGVLSAIELNF